MIFYNYMTTHMHHYMISTQRKQTIKKKCVALFKMASVKKSQEMAVMMTKL